MRQKNGQRLDDHILLKACLEVITTKDRTIIEIAKQYGISPGALSKMSRGASVMYAHLMENKFNNFVSSKRWV